MVGMNFAEDLLFVVGVIGSVFLIRQELTLWWEHSQSRLRFASPVLASRSKIRM